MHPHKLDKSKLLPPLKRQLGVSLFTVVDQNNQPVTNVELLRMKRGELLVTEWKSLIDESQVAKKIVIQPDMICTPSHLYP